VIEAFITNAGKYGEGELCGEWLRFPATKKEVQSLLSRIGVDGVLYEEYFITDYKTDIDGLNGCFSQYESIDELNYLASLLDDLDEWDIERFEAAVAHGYYANSVESLINLTQNLDCYDFYSDISDLDDLGRYLIDELGYEKIPERLENYFDYDSYGRDFSLNEGGRFVKGGYLRCDGDGFDRQYKGREDIPDKYRVFAYPDEKMPIREQLAMYSMMMSAPAADYRATPERADR